MGVGNVTSQQILQNSGHTNKKDFDSGLFTKEDIQKAKESPWGKENLLALQDMERNFDQAKSQIKGDNDPYASMEDYAKLRENQKNAGPPPATVGQVGSGLNIKS
jgi:hypothetical protein